MTQGTGMAALAGRALLGVGLTVVAWLVLVPWDLSEVTPGGTDIARGGDQSWPAIAAVLVVVFLAATMLVGTGRPAVGVPVGVAGAATWVVLFVWRVSTSRTSGANMWPIALVLFVVPAATATAALVAYLGRPDR